MSTPVVHYLKDYQAPQYRIVSCHLTFHLARESTRVINQMQVISQGEDNQPLVLDGEDLQLLSVQIDGVAIDLQSLDSGDESLTLPAFSGEKTIRIENIIHPERNTALQGLYASGGLLTTQCESHGFRRITYFIDRPDNLSLYEVTLIADKSLYPVLLSNGNLVRSGDLADGQHFCHWQDPFPKPSYLFALVAGDLAKNESTFTTQEGREVLLQLWSEPKNLHKTQFALEAAKRAMTWDEQRYGLSYDLDIYMIVAVDDFNAGAMENKGLNIFNAKFALAEPNTASDMDFAYVDAVIAHEYFHNWTGNRITCRDWFQLTLKEGLTVFRDQSYTQDTLLGDLKRIGDVQLLRANQFVEDAGPMSHPIQPQSYIEMNNFYTLTVYEKGAEVVRLYHTLLGEEGFQKGMQLYVKRHDGQAVTVEDFRQAMADANGVDLSQMHQWYVQPGTPQVKVEVEYHEAEQRLVLQLTQDLPKTPNFSPLLIPIKLKFFSETGQVLNPYLISGDAQVIQGQQWLVKLNQKQQSYQFGYVTQEPVLSILRDFSAPINLDFQRPLSHEALLLKADDNAFVRWEAAERLKLYWLDVLYHQAQQGLPLQLPEEAFVPFDSLWQEKQLPPLFMAELLGVPDFQTFANHYDQWQMDALLAAHQGLILAFAQRWQQAYLATYQQYHDAYNYVWNAQQLGQRRLKNLALARLLKAQHPQAKALLIAQIEAKTSMNDIQAAYMMLVDESWPEVQGYLQDFYAEWQQDPLVIDKWFTWQAKALGGDSIERVQQLMQHPAFIWTNPNRVRSLLGSFARLNPQAFHQADGAGYRLFVQALMKLDGINPQTTARLVQALAPWKKLDAQRQKVIIQSLDDFLAQDKLSKDVQEVLSKIRHG